MATDYEIFYRDNPHGLGAPTKEFVEFFDTYQRAASMVLDVGCGQGRDSLFVARQGHTVIAIDHAPSGIRDLRAEVAAEGLPIEAHVVDIRDYIPERTFDVILIDRTLHMLVLEERVAVLRTLVQATSEGAHILIADERRNMPALKAVLDTSGLDWTPTIERKGFLFVQRR